MHTSIYFFVHESIIREDAAQVSERWYFIQCDAFNVTLVLPAGDLSFGGLLRLTKTKMQWVPPRSDQPSAGDHPLHVQEVLSRLHTTVPE